MVILGAGCGSSLHPPFQIAALLITSKGFPEAIADTTVLKT